MSAPRMMLLLAFLLLSSRSGFALEVSPTAEKGGGSTVCKLEILLPAGVQQRLKQEFQSWRVQEATDLSSRARQRWESEKSRACPGIAAGHFESGKTLSYAVLLVPRGQSDSGYKLLVFSPKTGQASLEMTSVEQSSDNGAGNFFIRAARTSQFFDDASRQRFLAQASECILFVDAAENEYEADVYFWTKGGYQHQSVDY